MVCSECKKHFSKEDAPELNYNNYKSYKFSTKEKFKNHKSNSQKCPVKCPVKCHIKHNKSNNNSDKLTYPVYESYNKDINEAEYIYLQEDRQKRLNFYIDNNTQLWFNENIQATYDILENLNSETQFITLVAEPGAGKTNTIHCFIYNIGLRTYDNSISLNSITITTGMSDNEWFEQMKESFTLNIGDDNQYLWEPLKNENKNHCLTHRSNFSKRIEYLKNNIKLLNNHIFIIDESHIADSENMTLDEELKSLNLTLELMKKHNIKIILISATPDVNLSIMDREDNHKIVKLNTGSNYKGFNYFNYNNLIHNYEKETNLEDEIKKYEKTKYHFIRQRAQNKDIEDWNNICDKNDWELIEDDSKHTYYLSGKNDENEVSKENEGNNIIKLYNSPEKHTIIKLKNKYPAGKRLRLTSHIGLIAEKPSKQMDTSITCNSLIPRWFGYYDENEFEEKPKFICNIKCVEEYINFCENFTYKGTDYTSKRIKSTKKKLIEKQNTAYGSLVGGKATSSDSDIIISPIFDNVTLIRNYLLDECNFKKNDIKVEEISLDSFIKDDGKIWPKRNVPSHTFKIIGDTIITQLHYDNNLKGKSTFINRRGKNGTGQCFMIYPVYPESNSKNEEVKYYVHSLKM